MATDTISVMRMTRPYVKRILLQFRDATQLDNPVDITGYTIKFIVKKRLSDDDTLAFFDMTATIIDATNGVYQLAFSTIHTCLPAGIYQGEVRWWSGLSTSAPNDAVPVLYEVLEAVKRY